MNVIERWKEMVESEHAQTDRLRSAPPISNDYWVANVEGFKADPYRTDDPLLDRLHREIEPRHTLIDAGAGAGRLALPLALKCSHVTAVEPSPAMASAFQQQASDYNIRNVSLVEATWEAAEIQPADIVLCAHVLYTVREVGAFVEKLEAQANRRVLIIVFDAAPQSQVYPLWPRVHGEERLPLPSLPELKQVLEEMGISPRVSQLPLRSRRGYETLEQALEQIGSRLFLEPGSPKQMLLEQVVPGLLEEQHGELFIRDSRPQTPWLVSWEPGAPED